MTGPLLNLRTRQLKRALSITVRYEQLKDIGFELPNVHKDTKRIRNMLIGEQLVWTSRCSIAHTFVQIILDMQQKIS